MTSRYKCTACEQRKKDLVRQAVANGSTIPVKLKYTFMGWDPESLPLTAFGAGDQFPAFLTWRAGLDKSLIDMMRPAFDKGMRPEAFSEMVLELHTKNFFRCWLQYEREYMMEKKKSAFGGLQDWPEFSSFDNPSQWNDRVPTGAYFAKALKRFHSTLRSHFDREVKKRSGTTYASDASYKEASSLCQYKGKPIFSGLETVLTEAGEVRIQHHIVQIHMNRRGVH